MANFSQAEPENKRPIDYVRVLRQIEALRRMVVDRGCSVAEAALAAQKIGEALQRYGLVVRPPGYTPLVSERTVSFLDVEAIAETDKALLCAIDDRELWLPFSQIHKASEVQRVGDTGRLVVRRWFAERVGLCPRRQPC